MQVNQKKQARRFKDVVKFTKTMLPSRNLKPRACFNHATVNDALIISAVIILKAMDSLSSDVDKISVFWKLLLTEVRKREDISDDTKKWEKFENFVVPLFW